MSEKRNELKQIKGFIDDLQYYIENEKIPIEINSAKYKLYDYIDSYLNRTKKVK